MVNIEGSTGAARLFVCFEAAMAPDSLSKLRCHRSIEDRDSSLDPERGAFIAKRRKNS